MDTQVEEQRRAMRELTPRQRNVVVIMRTIANDMDINGAVAEQHTAALLRLACDAVDRGYEADLVTLARAWRRVREGEAR